MPDWYHVGHIRRALNTKLDGTGAGSVSFEVFSAHHKWELETVVVKAAGATPVLFPQVTLYNGSNQQDGRSQGASFLGAQVTFRGSITMDDGSNLTVGFASGTAGTVMTAIIEGESYLWR